MIRGTLFLVVTIIFGGFVSACAEDSIFGPLYPPVSLPDPNAKVVKFKTTLEISQRLTAGYVPIRIRFDALGTSTADLRLTYRFQSLPSGETPPRRVQTVDVPILVPQGTKIKTFTRLLPKWTAGQSVEISILEDGRLVEGCNASIGSNFQGQASRYGTFTRQGFGHQWLKHTEYAANWIIISDDKKVDWGLLPDPRVVKFGAISDSNWQSMPTENQRSIYQQQTDAQLRVARLNQLPNDWRAYQFFDSLVVREDLIPKLVQFPESYAAIRNWILNGGSMVVYNAKSHQQVMDQLRFGWSDDSESQEQTRIFASEEIGLFQSIIDDQRSYLADRHPTQDQIDQKRTSEGAGTIEPQAWIDLGYENMSADEVIESYEDQVAILNRKEKAPRLSLAELDKRFTIQNVGAGRVILMDASITNQEISREEIFWGMARRSIGHRMSPMIRRGVDPMVGDSRFSEWLIAGVAQPPVYTFMGLLTAFVLLVGPIAYRQTVKRNRSYLMFMIAPVLAFVTTALMFGYGIVADGFATIARVRQLTWVDGTSGDAGERIRATYFAGIRPSDGIRFPGDSEVLGYPNSNRLSWEQQHQLTPTVNGKIVIQENDQVFDSSFLPSREQRQFVTHRPRKNIGALELAESEDSETPPSVTNSFAFRLHEGIVRDSQGKYWKIKSLAPGETQLCEAWPEIPIGVTPDRDADTPSRTMGRYFNDYRPIAPVGQRSQTNARQKQNRTFDLISRTNQRYSDTETVVSGLFEHQLQSWLRDQSRIPKLHFVAIADVDPADLAIEDCEIVDSVRYVFGTLR